MGDTPSLLYLMHGEPNSPQGESWGGSFENMKFSPRVVFNKNTTFADTVPVYALMEFHFKGPEIQISEDSACFTMTVANQVWNGFYMGARDYSVRYAPKRAETLTYTIKSKISELNGKTGEFVVDNNWPGISRHTNYPFGANWYTDRSDPQLFDGEWQGARTIQKWRSEALLDWAARWCWLKE